MLSQHRREDVCNRILRALPAGVFEKVSPHLEAISLRPGQVLYQPGASVGRIYFINNGLVALIKTMRDGRSAMVGSRGIEGITTPGTVFGAVPTRVECIVQISGSAYSINLRVLRDLVAEFPLLRRLILEYGGLVVEQFVQISACNRLHTLEQRYAQLLLTAYDNVASDSFVLTQQFLAMTLGVQRPRISVLAGSFQTAGLISYKHGRMTISNPSDLKKMSCECYEASRRRIGQIFRNGAAPRPP